MSIYSLPRIRSSLMHFVFGNIFSASMGLAATLILVRELSVPDYSAYAIFLGLCLLIGGVTSFAIEHTAQRFIPELLTAGSKSQVTKYIFVALIAKTITLVVATSCLFLATDFVVEIFSLSMYADEIKVWPSAIFFIIYFRFQTVIMQIFMLHSALKWLNIIMSAGRLLLIVILVNSDRLDLMHVVIIDLAVNAVVLLLSFIAIFARLISLPEKKATALDDNKFFLCRLRKFVVFSALREFVYLFSGHAMNRLVVAKYVQTASFAAFGFAQSLLELVDRYLPSVFLNNMIQPIVMAKFSQHRDSTKIFDYGNLVMKANMFLLIPLVVWGLLLGTEGSLYITNNKYPQALEFFSALVILLVLKSHNYPLHLAAIALEKSKATFWASVILALSIFLALFFVNLMGVAGIVLARGVGMLIRDLYLYRTFSSINVRARVDHWAIAKSLVLGIAVYYLMLKVAPPPEDIWNILVAGACSFLLCSAGALVLRVISIKEINLMRSLLSA